VKNTGAAHRIKSLGPLAMLLALFWPAAGALADGSQCSPSTIKFGTLLDGRILVPVTVEGHKLWFLLDTGGVVTTIKLDLAKELGLPVKQSDLMLSGVGGSLLNFNVTAENFSLGDLRLKSRQIYIETRNIPFADGTLAADILRDYDVEIDLANGKLSLNSPGYCAISSTDAIAMDVDRNGHIRFPVKLDGTTIMATFDTGSALSLLRMDTASRLGIYPNSSALGSVGNAGQYRMNAYSFQSLDFGGVSVKNPHIVAASDRLVPETQSVLLLGMDAFHFTHFSIAYGEKRIFILPVARPASGEADRQLVTPK